MAGRSRDIVLYYHKDPAVMYKRFLLVESFTAELIKRKIMVYSPIVHCHSMAVKYNLPKDFEFWKGFCLHFLDKSDQMIVYMINGWKESVGVQEEIEYTHDKGIPIEYFKGNDYEINS